MAALPSPLAAPPRWFGNGHGTLPTDVAVRILSMLSLRDLKAFSVVHSDWLGLLVTADGALSKPLSYAHASASFVDAAARVYDVQLRPASVRILRRELGSAYSGRWEDAGMLPFNARAAVMCGRGDSPYLVLQCHAACGDQLRVYRVGGAAPALVFAAKARLPRAVFLSEAYHVLSSNFLVVMRAKLPVALADLPSSAGRYENGDCVMVLSPAASSVIFHIRPHVGEDLPTACLAAAADGCDLFITQPSLGYRVDTEYEFDMFGIRLERLRRGTDRTYDDFLHRMQMYALHMSSDDMSAAELFGDGQLAMMQALNLVPEGATDAVLDWESVMMTARLYPLALAPITATVDFGGCKGRNTFFFVDRFCFPNAPNSLRAWVVFRQAGANPYGLGRDAVYAWDICKGEPAFTVALSRAALVVGMCDGRILLLREALPAWSAAWVQTRVPLHHARVVPGGQAAGVFIVSCGTQRHVFDLRHLMAVA